METILLFLKNELKATAFPKIGAFLDHLAQGNRNEKLFAYCLAIDIKHGLLKSADYIELLNEFLSTDMKLNFWLEDFYLFVKSLPEANLFSAYNVNKETFRYVRVITSQSFINHISIKPLALDNTPFEIDSEAFIRGGKKWSGDKKIVWVTLYEDFIKVLYSCSDTEERASRICDFLGWSRDHNFKNGAAPALNKKYSLLAILYPPGFPFPVFQPNATNACWNSHRPLYVSHPFADGFGKTYNEFGSPFAKEGIHKEVAYWQDGFGIIAIGEPRFQMPDSDNILNEADFRFK